MALKPEEITRIEQMASDMAKSIEDRDGTSNEAAIVYSKIGKVCTSALAKAAAATAKRETRTSKVSQFQSARQARASKKGTASTTPPQAPTPTRKQA